MEALHHYKSQIEKLNALIEVEYSNIIHTKKLSERKDVSEMQQAPAHIIKPSRWDIATMSVLQTFLPRNYFAKEEEELCPIADCGIGFVEFSTRATKQAAIQCNLTGEVDYFVTQEAPDPREIFWENAPTARATISKATFVVELVLLVGVLFWSVIAALVGNIKVS